ncbi:MAG: PaaI family thioesterase [Cognatishimia sp.]
MSEQNSAFQSHLGYRLTHWDVGYARIEQSIEPFLMNRIGIPHGGNYGVILDTAMGFSGVYTGNAEQRAYAVTLSLNVQFIAPARGKMLFAEAETLGGGKRVFFAEGRITDEDGRLVAHGSGSFQRRESA